MVPTMHAPLEEAEAAFVKACHERGVARLRYIESATLETARDLEDAWNLWRAAGDAYLEARFEAQCVQEGLAAPDGWEEA